MNIKENFRELIKWGSENEQNKKKAIHNALSMIAILTEKQGKISDEELEKIAAGDSGIFFSPKLF